MARTWSARLNGELLRSIASFGPVAAQPAHAPGSRPLVGARWPAAAEVLACLYTLLASAVIAQLTFGPAFLSALPGQMQPLLCILGVSTMLLLLIDRRKEQAHAASKSLSSAPAIALERRAQQLAVLADEAARTAEAVEAEAATSAELLGRISHAMRTPLNAIIGFSDVMEKELFGPLGHPRYQDYSTHIREAGFDLLGATEDVLAISRLANRPATLRHGEVDLDIVLISAIRAAADFAKSKAVSIAPPQKHDLIVCADMRGLRQALVNVLCEVASAAGPGSTLHCETASQGDKVCIEVSMAPGEAGLGAAPGGESLSVAKSVRGEHQPLRFAIAEALLSLQGARLEIMDGKTAKLRARIHLAGAA